MLSLTSTISLEPEPIPLDIKVILMGDRRLYYLLSAYDPDFAELFKVAADLDDRSRAQRRQPDALRPTCGTLVRKEELRPFDRSAVARVIDHSAAHGWRCRTA